MFMALVNFEIILSCKSLLHDLCFSHVKVVALATFMANTHSKANFRDKS